MHTIELLKRLAPAEGTTRSALADVNFVRVNRSTPRKPVLYEPSLVFFVQGRKRCFFGDQMYIYDAEHYLALSVSLPLSSEVDASEAEPMLGISIRIDPTLLAELVFAIDQTDSATAAAPAGLRATKLEPAMQDALRRLLAALSSPLDARILGPAIVREIYFRVLMGEQGAAMRAALTTQSNFGRIAKALRRIHADYTGDLDVGMLASEAHMSVPAFHAHFKAVTQCSPIQYIKSARLHRARLLMIRDDVTASAAAAEVGYESPSQFSREFKRFFGKTPGEEAASMRAMLTVSPAAGELVALPD